MQVKEILGIKGKVLYTVTTDKKLSEAVAVMCEHDVGAIVCFENSKMVGILTFREVLRALNEHRAAWGGVEVRSVMSRHPHIIEPGLEVNALRHLMVTQHARYLPVMDGETLLGVISYHDIARAVLEAQHFENQMLKDYIRDWPAGHPESGVDETGKN